MKYYTSTISTDLAKKLKEKGMRIITVIRENYLEGGYYPPEIITPVYAEVFDWLIEKGIYISVSHLGILRGKQPYYEAYMNWNNTANEKTYTKKTWYSAANAAIEKALTLI